MLKFPTVWVDYTPDTLLDLTIRYCVKNPHSFCKYSKKDEHYVLREGLSLPEELCQRFLAVGIEEYKDKTLNCFLHIFEDTLCTRLRRGTLQNTAITDKTLQVVTKHNITHLDISGCESLTSSALSCIQRLSPMLGSLNVGACIDIFPRTESSDSSLKDKHLKHHCMGLLHACLEDVAFEGQKTTTLELPNLRHFSVHGINWADSNCFMSVIQSAQYLSYLDLEGCELPSDFRVALTKMPHLTTLILCDVKNIKEFIFAVCELKQLIALDLSNSLDQFVEYENPNQILKLIVGSIENLASLDISGTNLAGNRTQERYAEKAGNSYSEPELTDIPGLMDRVNRPLEFLGLLNAAHDACYRHHIPALKVSGDASEEQILVAGQMYVARENMIQKVLNDLFQTFRFSNCTDMKMALDIVMEAMKQHLKVKYIQISGSASLFYIVKGEYKDMFNMKMRRKVIKTLIDAMECHITDVTMLRNGCLTLIHFKIPSDVFFEYERLASLLLKIVAQDDQDEFVQRIAVYLLNSLACQVDGIEKKLVGDRGAIEIMLQVVEKRLLRRVCDEVMETAWSTMWNVTDETPVNCERFLRNKGMDLFLGCLEHFPEKPELLRNMMGLLGNVAEVKELRHWLMKDEYLSVFSELLQSKSDGIEVSYNAAGILSHIASDGPAPWTTHNITTVQRSQVLAKMINAIGMWDLSTKRNINYRSFKPILRLVGDVTSNCEPPRHWAVWALANLTTVYPEKYCQLLKEEGGLEMLKVILDTHYLGNRTRELACITLENCLRHESNMSRDIYDSSEEDSDTLDVT